MKESEDKSIFKWSELLSCRLTAQDGSWIRPPEGPALPVFTFCPATPKLMISTHTNTISCIVCVSGVSFAVQKGFSCFLFGTSIRPRFDVGGDEKSQKQSRELQDRICFSTRTQDVRTTRRCSVVGMMLMRVFHSDRSSDSAEIKTRDGLKAASRSKRPSTGLVFYSPVWSQWLGNLQAGHALIRFKHRMKSVCLFPRLPQLRGPLISMATRESHQRRTSPSHIRPRPPLPRIPSSLHDSAGPAQIIAEGAGHRVSRSCDWWLWTIISQDSLGLLTFSSYFCFDSQMILQYLRFLFIKSLKTISLEFLLNISCFRTFAF